MKIRHYRRDVGNGIVVGTSPLRSDDDRHGNLDRKSWVASETMAEVTGYGRYTGWISIDGAEAARLLKEIWNNL